MTTGIKYGYYNTNGTILHDNAFMPFLQGSTPISAVGYIC